MIDSFPEKEFIGKVTYISPEAEFTPKNIQTKEERVKLVFGVKIEVDNPDQELKVGMPADAIIEAENSQQSMIHGQRSTVDGKRETPVEKWGWFLRNLSRTVRPSVQVSSISSITPPLRNSLRTKVNSPQSTESTSR